MSTAKSDHSAAALFKSDPQLKDVDAAKWNKLASDAKIEKVKTALEAKTFKCTVVNNSAEALKTLVALIPEGASISTGGSTTLTEIGFTDYAKKETKWNNFHSKALEEKDQTKSWALRVRGYSADYFISSVCAISENGDLVVCDASGTRVGGFLGGAKNLIVVVGSNKFVPTYKDAIDRMEEYCLPVESARARVAYGIQGSQIAFVASIKSANPFGSPHIHVIVVKEKLGY